MNGAPPSSLLEHLLPPAWMMAAVLACLPLTAVALWLAGRWWLSGRPFPLPDGRAMPAVRLRPLTGFILFVAMFVLMQGIGSTYYLLVKAGLVPWERPEGAVFTVGALLAQVVPPLVGLVVVVRLGRGAAGSIGVRAGRLGRGLGLGLAGAGAVFPLCVAAMIASSILFALLGLPARRHPLLDEVAAARDGWVLAAALVQAGLLAPLAEEFMYRGVLMMSLLKQAGPAAALVASSALFAVAHLPAQPPAILPLFLLGLALGYAAYRTRSLVAPIVAHSAFNVVMLLGQFFGT